MTDDELITELLNRIKKSYLFCLRVLKACDDFLKKLDEEE